LKWSYFSVDRLLVRDLAKRTPEALQVAIVAYFIVH
jgi:hypothetical protein